MSHSAYAPPSADLRTERDGVGNGEFDFGIALSEAWSNTWANFGLWLGVSIVAGVAFMLSAITVIGIVFLVPVLAWGMMQFYVRMHDGTATFGDMFSGFSCYGRALGGMLMFGFAWLVIWLPGQVLSQVGTQSEDLALSLLSLVFNLGAMAILARLVFTPLLMVDRDLSCADALSRSWEVTSNLKWKMIGLMFLQSLLMLAGLVVFLVGVIPASVMSYLMVISAYRQVVGGPIASA